MAKPVTLPRVNSNSCLVIKRSIQVTLSSISTFICTPRRASCACIRVGTLVNAGSMVGESSVNYHGFPGP